MLQRVLSDVRLYIGNKRYSSWSMRPWVLLRSLGIPFEEQLIPFDTDNGNPALAEISPTGKVPALQDRDILVWDSLAIIEYLGERLEVWPDDVRARSWARCAVSEMHSGFSALRDECSMSCRLVINHGSPSGALKKELYRIDELWREGLMTFGGPWLAGERFSAVDAYYAPVAVRLRGYNLNLSRRCMAYADRLLAHEAIDSWVSAGIAEDIEDQPHVDDCVRGRHVVKDRRFS